MAGGKIYFLERRALFILCLLVPAIFIFGICGILAYNSYKKATDAAIQATGTQANLLAKLILANQRATVGILRATARQPVFMNSVKRRDYEAVLQHLANLTKGNPEIEWPYVANPDSRIWVNFPVDKQVINKDLSWRDWYIGVSKEWKPYVSNVYEMLVGEKDLAVTVAVPVFNEKGEVVGILGAAQSAKYFGKIIDEASSSSDIRVTLIDREGQIIHSTRFPYKKEVIAYPPLAFIKKALKGERGDVEIQDSSEGNRVKYVSCAPLEGVGWSVITERGRDEVLRSEYSYFALLAATAFLMFGVVVLSLIYLRARHRQIKELEKANEALDGRVRERTQSLSEEITERKRAEEGLRESEERLQLTLQASEVGTFEVELTTGVGRWNAIEYELLGLRPGDATGGPETFFRYVHPQDVAELRARWEEATRTGRLDAEFRIIRADGQERWLAGKGQFLFAETADAASAGGKRSPLQFLGVNFDITERKRVEEERKRFQDAIQEERDRLSALVNSITDEIWFADTQKKFTLANPSALREFGFDTAGNGIEVEELARNLETFRPDGSPRPVEETPPLRSLQGEVIRNEEEIIRTPARGELRHRQISSTPVKNAAGAIVGSVSVVRDITELKRMEGELRKSRDELELRVRARTEELAKSQIRLQNLSSQLLLAHEKERRRVAIELHDGLLSELAAMKYLLEGKVVHLDQGKIVNADELRRISDILGTTMKEARRIMNNLHPFVLDELGFIAAMKWVCGEYQKSYPHILIQTEIGITERDISDGIRVVIFRVLQEALNNFARHGNGRRVEIALSKTDRNFSLLIRDDGQGFDMEKVQMGLGLESMRERVELSGGEFQIESIIGQGTTIRAIWSI